MPLGPGVRFRVKTTKSGKKVRLGFKGKKVVEAKVLPGPETIEDNKARRYARRRKTGLD